MLTTQLRIRHCQLVNLLGRHHLYDQVSSLFRWFPDSN